jgi:hypothetical protein
MSVSMAAYLWLGERVLGSVLPTTATHAAPGLPTNPAGIVLRLAARLQAVRVALLALALTVMIVAATAQTIRRGVPRPNALVGAPTFGPLPSLPIILAPLLHFVITAGRVVVGLLVALVNQVKISMQWMVYFLMTFGDEAVALAGGVLAAIVEFNVTFITTFALPMALMGYLGWALWLLGVALTSYVLRAEDVRPALVWAHIPLVLLAATAYLQAITRRPLDALTPSTIPSGVSLLACAVLGAVFAVAAALTLWVAAHFGVVAEYSRLHPLTVYGLVLLVVGAGLSAAYAWARSR